MSRGSSGALGSGGGAGIAPDSDRVGQPDPATGPEFKAAKNRLHRDLLVNDADREIARLVSLSTTVLPPGVREEFGQRWLVLAHGGYDSPSDTR